jgi:hypothetical protein
VLKRKLVERRKRKKRDDVEKMKRERKLRKMTPGAAPRKTLGGQEKRRQDVYLRRKLVVDNNWNLQQSDVLRKRSRNGCVMKLKRDAELPWKRLRECEQRWKRMNEDVVLLLVENIHF